MTNDFLIGAIRASRDLHPNVKTELEEILRRDEQCMKQHEQIVAMRRFCKECGAMIPRWGDYCAKCGKAVARDVERNDG
ncbi:MAG: hypothetical protein IKQ01_06375 [Bacteroidales bacterium]|nr:hypothetical protein [Bacteroidales bacterium]